MKDKERKRKKEKERKKDIYYYIQYNFAFILGKKKIIYVKQIKQYSQFTRNNVENDEEITNRCYLFY